MCEGKSFRIHAAATGKARRTTVESLTAGTDRLSVVEDRSLCRRRPKSSSDCLSFTPHLHICHCWHPVGQHIRR